MSGNERTGTRASLALTLAAFVVVGLVALLPRVLDLGGFVTIDESNYWMSRSERFLQAIQAGDFAGTAIRPHPGVTTMWLGSAGIVLRRTLLEWGWLQEMPFETLLALMRLPAALVHTAGVLMGYALLRRMLPAAVALLAALLWAADPFVIAFSRVLHLDGLETTFLTLGLLAACLYWHHTRHPAALLLSAVCVALAVLSKVPALVVLPVIGVLALASRFWHLPGNNRPQARPAGRLAPLPALLAWGGVFALTIAVVWPAVWADPLRVADLLRESVEEEGLQPHMWGNYYMGERNDVPGLSFYPVAVALRLTPWTLAGVLLLPLAWRHARDLPAARRDLLVLVGFVIFFVLVMSVFPKKFNRYIVPVFPALDILAAAGLVWSAERLRGLLCRVRTAGLCAPRITRAALVGTCGLAAVGNAAHWHPYSIAAFNQALGGAPAGAYAFAYGWGEGLDQVADWLQEQPDITGVTVASTMINSFQPLLERGIQSVSPDGPDLSEQVGYVVIYVRDVQRDSLGQPFERFYQQVPPLHTVTIHGVDYAWIYQVPPDLQHTTDVRFGETLHLMGYEVDTSALRTAGEIWLTVQWQATRSPPENYKMFTHLLDEQGQRVAQVDTLPAGPARPPGRWEPGRYVTWEYPLLVPADLPAGDYWLAIGLYHPETFARLPVSAEPPPGAPDAGGDALLLPVRIDDET